MRSPAAPIALFYFTFFGALGIFWPFFSLLLTSRGLSPTEATRVLALYPAMTLLAPPFLGLLADAWQVRGWLVRALSFGTTLAFAAFLWARSPAILVVTTLVYGLMRAPLTPMTDAATFDTVRRHGGSYGRVRLWGSIGFLGSALLGGELLDRASIDGVVLATVCALGLSTAAAFAIPAPPPREQPRVFAAWRAMLAEPDLWLFLLAAALAQAAHATYDSAFTLHLKNSGFGGRFIGAAWSIGVAAEVLLMAASGGIVRRIGAGRLFAGAVAIAALRWAALSSVRAPGAILALQPLHGISFGLMWVGGVTAVRDRAPAETQTAAQGLFASAIGLGSVAGMSFAGQLLERGGARLMFGVAAGVAALAAAVAGLTQSGSTKRATIVLRPAARK